jgi:lipoyl(octanoyl) transferase
MNRSLDVLDAGRMPYGPALDLQERLVARRKAREIPDTLVLVEHDPVFTLGRNATEANVLLSPDELRARGIEVVRTSRGGQVTYHGPGQLVGYPIVHLGDLGQGVLAYVSALERTLIRVLADYGVAAVGDSANRGVWVGRDKIAALGIRVTGQVTMHGFALNVAVDPASYGGIVPCGIRDRGVTSLHLLAPGAAMADVKARTVARFAETLGFTSVHATSAASAVSVASGTAA